MKLFRFFNSFKEEKEKVLFFLSGKLKSDKSVQMREKEEDRMDASKRWKKETFPASNFSEVSVTSPKTKQFPSHEKVKSSVFF